MEQALQNNIEFYYWNHQCPHNNNILNILKKVGKDKSFNVKLYDVSKDYNLAKKINMYSPTLLIFNNNMRWNGPISIDFIQKISNNQIIERKPYTVKNSLNRINGEIRDLIDDTVLDTYTPCGCSNKKSCSYKSNWIKNLMDKYNLPHLGKLHYFNDYCVGGAEFVPTHEAPYDIPKGNDIAFLTCSFVSSEIADYKSYPLEKLENDLPNLGFKSILAIASEDVVFPNGTVDWFLSRDYLDRGVLYYEENDYAKMHLVEKKLY